MKKLSLLILISTLFAFNACKVNQQHAASKVAEEFLDNLNNKKFAKAKKLCTEETAANIDMMQTMANMSNENKPAPVMSNMFCNVDGDKATFQYTENGMQKQLELVKIKGKWLVVMKKETPDMNTNNNSNSEQEQRFADSAAVVERNLNNNNQYQGNNTFNQGLDTVTYFDLGILSMNDLSGNAHIKFNIVNRSDWNIKHFWLETYISDKAGKFLQKDELMFDGIMNNKMLNNISNVDAVLEKNKIELILKNTKTEDIGEVFLLPVRIQLDQSSDQGIPFDIGVHNVAKRIILRNDSSYKVNITF